MTLTMIFLAYIMIEVGMEFDIDKSRLGSYAVDYGIAMAAAAVPWLCAALYFWWFFSLGFNESLLVGRFASPTSAGILFTMLAAAGLATTWVYKKARVLAIFDDLDTVLLMIPLKMMLIGFEPKLLILIFAVFLLLAAAYFCIHWLPVPTTNAWIVIYALLVWGVTYAFDYVTDLHLEVLVPAFALGLRDQVRSSARLGGVRRHKPWSECSRIPRTGDLGLGDQRRIHVARGHGAAADSIGRLGGRRCARACDSHHRRQQHRKVRAHDGVQRRSHCTPTLGAQHRHVPARRGRHRRAAGFAGNLSPAEHARLARGAAKHDHRHPQLGAEPCAYRSFHHGSDSVDAKVNTVGN